MNTVDKIVQLVQDSGMNGVQYGKHLGLKKSPLTDWKNGQSKPTFEQIKKTAALFNVSMHYFSEVVPMGGSDTLRIPIYVSIPAGIPMEAIEYIDDYEEAPMDWTAGDKEFFGIKIKGDSMSPEYRNGDVVIFKKQNTCESGEDCAVMVNSYEATFKKVELLDNGIILKPFNPTFKAQYYSTAEIEQLPIKILGVFWELRRKRK